MKNKNLIGKHASMIMCVVVFISFIVLIVFQIDSFKQKEDLKNQIESEYINLSYVLESIDTSDQSQYVYAYEEMKYNTVSLKSLCDDYDSNDKSILNKCQLAEDVLNSEKEIERNQYRRNAEQFIMSKHENILIEQYQLKNDDFRFFEDMCNEYFRLIETLYEATPSIEAIEICERYQ